MISVYLSSIIVYQIYPFLSGGLNSLNPHEEEEEDREKGEEGGRVIAGGSRSKYTSVSLIIKCLKIYPL